MSTHTTTWRPGRAAATIALAVLLGATSVGLAQAQIATVETVDGHAAAKGEVIVNFYDPPTDDLVQYLTSVLDADQMRQIAKLVRRQTWRLRSKSLDIPTLLAHLQAYG